ncbi:response regulator [Geobacter hydrogenophilus]|uniref:histidine kinase n=1 Tax=Geobacter hydrogenophilus TaxID=40983 RepID=A0A9W6L9S4_9BACT|nr:ATP-binding protein [Geobacter hydrogenophilus]MBT0894847.1 response regulator [Geobacter hydrogenophilus]GLI36748.1 histidine kinase [Geobacter hydrogenophilus]
MDLINTLKNRRDSVGLRFFLLFTLFIAVISVSFTVFFFQQQRSALKDSLVNEGKLLAKLLAHNIRLGVFAENAELLRDPIQGILEHEGVLFVSIVTAEGKALQEQAHKKVINNSGRAFPHWSSRFERLKGTAEPSVYEGDDIFEFWAPVMSSSSVLADESLFLDQPPRTTPRVIGYARIIVDKNLLGEKLDTLLYTSVFMAAGFLLLGTFFTYIITRRITRPLDRLTEGIRVLERGGSFEPVPVESKDEIGRLATAFNHLGTTLKTREAEKELLAEELRHAQKMEAIGTLAGGVAHDFNNILTAIVGFGTLLQRSLKNDNPYRIYVEQILSAADRATNLVKRLLAFGRKQVISPHPTNLNDIVKGIEKLLHRLVSEDITFVTSLSREPLVCHVDAGQIDQILMNLVTNARDAMPDGGTLTVTTGSDFLEEDFFGPLEKGKTGYYAILTIADSGTGMDGETQERIFDPFFTTKEVGKGTGLGLSMVYGIVKQHDGFITVDSEPGKGTAVRIYLPIVATKETAERHETAIAAQGNQETILIAEDDRDVRKLSKLVLERSGYTVIEASDGAEAVRRFMENRDKIDLLLLDVVMPKKNGQSVYEEIRRARPEMKALFISGYTQDIINRKGVLDEGINFIAKPVKPDELLTKIKEVLKN